MHCPLITTLGAAAALAIALPAVAQPYGTSSYGPAPPYAQQRGTSPVPAPGYGPPTGGYSAPYVAPAQSEGAAAAGAYGADTAYAAPMVSCDNGPANSSYQCDQMGAYWSYGDTAPYDADAAARADPNAAAYVSRGCRLAPAQASGAEQRYVRVCPDGSGKYRVGG
jgi:hypothetical protein